MTRRSLTLYYGMDPVVEPTEPSCCPDAYLCPTSVEIECPRHGGFDVCCDRPDAHIPQDRESWHRQMDRYERALLDAHIEQHLLTTS